MVIEIWARRNSKDIDKTLSKHFRKFKIEVTCQVKVRSKVKIGVFRLRTVETLNVAFFDQNFPYVLPRSGRRYWLVIFFTYSSGQGQGQVKKVTKQKKWNESFDTCFMVYFWRRIRSSRLYYNLASFEPKNAKFKSLTVQKFQKMSNLHTKKYFENKDMLLMQIFLSNPMEPLVSCMQARTLKNAFERITSSLGTMGKTKTFLLG